MRADRVIEMRQGAYDDLMAERASKDAEILRLRGLLQDTAFALEAVNVQLEAWGKQSPLNVEAFLDQVRAALSSPAPQDDVIVPRELLRRVERRLSHLSGEDARADWEAVAALITEGQS